MEIKIYHSLPQEAKEIREEVFVVEQGFQEEYDEIDDIATHFVLFDDQIPVATCRVFPGEEKGVYLLGRLAVKKEYRRKGLGRWILDGAEKYLKEQGEQGILLHSQWHAKDFYEKAGYAPYGEMDEVEGCPHIWMKKNL